MSIVLPNLKGIVTALCLIVMNSLPLTAQTADLQDESALLDALAKSDAAGSRKIERQLQALWSKSGSASVDLLLKRGRDALELEDGRAAIEHFTALTDHAPDFAEGWSARASAYFSRSMFGPAMADLEQALALNPNNYNAMFGVGAILEMYGQDARAYEIYQRVKSIHPHHEDVSKALERLKPRIEGTSL
ncbi:tetratricopeptide repeat protein [Arenibacterium sp. CAU 1754]